MKKDSPTTITDEEELFLHRKLSYLKNITERFNWVINTPISSDRRKEIRELAKALETHGKSITAKFS